MKCALFLPTDRTASQPVSAASDMSAGFAILPRPDTGVPSHASNPSRAFLRFLLFPARRRNGYHGDLSGLVVGWSGAPEFTGRLIPFGDADEPHTDGRDEYVVWLLVLSSLSSLIRLPYER